MLGGVGNHKKPKIVMEDARIESSPVLSVILLMAAHMTAVRAPSVSCLALPFCFRREEK